MLKFTKGLSLSAATIAIAASLTLLSSPAQAQSTCDLNGTDNGDNAPDANDGATAPGTDATACGRNSGATQAGGVAIGTGATAAGPSGTNPIFATVAIGFNTIAHDNAVAIGNTAIARFGGTANPLAVGINSAVALGASAVAVGSNTVAIGTTSRAGTGFALNSPGAPVNAGNNITVIGGRAEANQNDATAIGADSEISAERGTALGSTTRVSQAGGIAIGQGAQALGPSVNNTIFASTAVGFNAIAQDNSSAFGNAAVARFSGTFTPTQPGTNAAVAVGTNAVAIGANTVAIGTTSRAGTGFAFNDPAGTVNPGFNQTAVGGRAETNATGGTALGANTNVSGTGGTAVGQDSNVFEVDGVAMGNGANVQAGATGSMALGSGSNATAANAVALGAGSVADRANTVSVGAAGAERQITNVAAGTAATDAVNVGQLNTAIAGATGAAAAAQGTANTALANAAAAQGTANTALANANTALSQNTVQTAQITALQTTTTTQGAQISAIQTLNTTQDNRITAAELLNTQQNNRLTALEAITLNVGAQVETNRRQANGGIATAMALGGMMVVPDSNVSINFNLSTYRGEQGFAGGVVARVGQRVYVNAGVAGSTVRGSTGGRVGVAFGF